MADFYHPGSSKVRISGLSVICVRGCTPQAPHVFLRCFLFVRLAVEYLLSHHQSTDKFVYFLQFQASRHLHLRLSFSSSAIVERRSVPCRCSTICPPEPGTAFAHDRPDISRPLVSIHSLSDHLNGGTESIRLGCWCDR